MTAPLPRTAHPPRFAVAITCIDGRIHHAVQDGLRRRLGVDFLDVVTLPGPDLVLAQTPHQATAVWHAVQVSLDKHAAERVVLVGHTDCAANPASPGTHRAQIGQAVATLRARLGAAAVEGMLLDTVTGSLDPVTASDQRAAARLS